MDTLPARKQLRLKGYDYSQNGYYFVTICTEDKGNALGNIKDKEMILSNVGIMVGKWWLELENKFPNIKLWEYVLMPNHIHGIIEIKNLVGAGFPRPQQNNGRGDRAPTLGQIIGYYKYQSTKYCRLSGLLPSIKLWQRNYHEHIIRSDDELQEIRRYISNNPKNWKKDKLYFK